MALRTVIRLLASLVAGAVTLAGAHVAVSHPAVPHPGKSHRAAPLRDRFTGAIATATGRYRRRHGRSDIDLSFPRGRPRVTVSISALPCITSSGCLKLEGPLTGTLTPMRTLPDIGGADLLTVSGTIQPLGHVTGTGVVHGTGFIARGHETLTLTLTSAHGKVTLTALSGPLAGFTSP